MSPTEGLPMSEGERLRESFLVFGRPVIGEAEIQEVVDSLRSGWIGTGPKVKRFERRRCEEYVGVAVRPLRLVLHRGADARAEGARDRPGRRGDRPVMTFVASANSVEHPARTTVLVDCEPGTGLIDLDAAEAAITDRTRAIMPVHLAGPSARHGSRQRACATATGLPVIEDAAHAIGAEWRGTRIGGHGNIAAYSFYVTKNITTIEGGALATRERGARRAQSSGSRSTGSASAPGSVSPIRATGTTRSRSPGSSST